MSNRLKIVLISNTSNFFNAFMLNHIEQLSKKYDLFVCCSEAHKLKKITPNNVSLINMNFKRGINIFHDIFAFFLTLIFFLKTRPTLSISFTPKIGFMVAIASFISMTPKRIHWFTGQIWVTRTGLKRLFYKLIDKLIFSLSNTVLIDSISQKNFLIKENVVSKNKSNVVHKGSVGGVDVQKFKFSIKIRNKLRNHLSISNETFVFLYLGRINKDKGIVDLVNAFKKIEQNNDAILIFVGSIEDNQLIEMIYNKKKILHFSFTKRPEDWFSTADVLCLPSYREGFGTVVIEAASCGIPSLCSNIYGLKDSIINNKTGFFHKPGSVNDIKKKMLYMIRNRKLVKKCGIFAKKRASENFEKSLITKKLLGLINSYISKNEHKIFK